MDFAQIKIRNHLTLGAHMRRMRRNLSLSWALAGRDVLITFACGVMSGMLIGFGLLVAVWR